MDYFLQKQTISTFSDIYDKKGEPFDPPCKISQLKILFSQNNLQRLAAVFRNHINSVNS